MCRLWFLFHNVCFKSPWCCRRIKKLIFPPSVLAEKTEKGDKAELQMIVGVSNKIKRFQVSGYNIDHTSQTHYSETKNIYIYFLPDVIRIMVKSETQICNLLAFESLWSRTWDFTVLKCPREMHIPQQCDEIEVLRTREREVKLKAHNLKGYIISYTNCWHLLYKWELDLWSVTIFRKLWVTFFYQLLNIFLNA